MNRAYATFEVKSVDQEQRVLEGIASTPEPDRQGDSMNPMGAKFKLPIPFLFQHGKDPFVGPTAVGFVVSAKPTKSGIPVRIEMAKADAGHLKEILDFAWNAIQIKVVRGLSIGWKPLAPPVPLDPKNPFGPVRWDEWDWGELSAVTIPANQSATIARIKSLCAPVLSDTGTQAHRPTLPAVVGVARMKESRMATPIGEQITTAQAELRTKTARFEELIALEGADGSLEDAQVVERDSLNADIRTLSGRVDRLKTLELAQGAQARQVMTKAADTDVRDSVIHRPSIQGPTPPKLEPGQSYARAVICKLQGMWQQKNAFSLAREYYPNHEALHLFLKEDVPAMSTRDTTWGGSLVYPENLASEFVDWLRPQTIIGRLPTQAVPFNVRMNKQTSAGAGYWVGEGRAKPLTWWGFSPTTFGEYKVANIAVLTQEQARFSSPSAELLVRNELAAACLERLDRDFVDPNKAISANVSPASITNGIVNLNSTGTALTNVLQDVTLAMNSFADVNIAPTHWIMSVRNAIALSLMVTSTGVRAFPEMSANGGTFAGLPVIVSNYVVHGTPQNSFVVLVSAPNIWVADDGGFTIDASREASLEMNDAPTMSSGPLGSPVGATGSVVVSMFQTNSVAIRCERFINWARKRNEAVAWIDDVNWAAS